VFSVDGIILVVALLLILATASSKFSSRFGVPALVVFLALGMLAGSEGLGGIEFEDYSLAHGIGTIALALILFDGGLRTSLESFRLVLWPALTLATVGVVTTALMTGLAAHLVLGVTLLEGMLLGAIVGSTDAAAVFAALRGRALQLSPRLAATLEVESASNDPMAIFLTVAFLEVLLGRLEIGWELLRFLALQATLGAAVGWLIGRAAAALNLRINLDSAGLYPILMAAMGLLAYGLAASLGGSGFLAVYLAGIVIGNRRVVFQRGVYLFSDGLAWLAQISMFVVLGLLSFPSRLLEVAGAGLLIAAVLILLARPLTVAVLLAPFGFNLREMAFVSWAGLKGAVPIVLGMYPLLFGLPLGGVLFDVVFFSVVVSALAQGWTLPWVARWLRLEQPARPEAPVTLEISSLRDVDGDIVEYTVDGASRAAGRVVRDLGLPDGAVVAMIARGGSVIPPRGTTALVAGDHVFLVLRPDVRTAVDRVFGTREAPLGEVLELPLRPSTRVADLRELYEIEIDAPGETRLEELLRDRLGRSAAVPGARLELPGLVLTVRDVRDGLVDLVTLTITLPPEREG